MNDEWTMCENVVAFRGKRLGSISYEVVWGTGLVNGNLQHEQKLRIHFYPDPEWQFVPYEEVLVIEAGFTSGEITTLSASIPDDELERFGSFIAAHIVRLLLMHEFDLLPPPPPRQPPA